MQAVQKDLMNMLVRELKEELEARDQPKTGNKAWLRRRLHTARSCARILPSESMSESHRECTEHRYFYRFVKWVKLLPF